MVVKDAQPPAADQSGEPSNENSADEQHDATLPKDEHLHGLWQVLGLDDEDEDEAKD